MRGLSKRLQAHGSILDLVDPLITTQALMATVKVGMWKRNGTPVEGPVRLYDTNYRKKNDLLMLQVRAP